LLLEKRNPALQKSVAIREIPLSASKWENADAIP